MIYTYKEFLTESYTTQKDLEKLTEEILTLIIEKTLNNSLLNDKIEYLESITLNEINYKNYKDTDIINFIGYKNRNIKIVILKNEDIEGYQFEKNDNAVYLPDNNLILIKIEDYQFNDLNETFEKHKDDDKLLTWLLYTLSSKFFKPLLHELQHVFDDCRSDGKAIYQSDDYVKDTKIAKALYSIDFDQLKKDEWEFISKHSKEYLNLKHEVDARFTTAIKDVYFYDLDWDKTMETNKEYYIIKPFDTVLKDFKYKYQNFKVLDDYHKKRVLKKLGQFYELEKDFVKKLNNEPTKKY